MLGTDLRAFPRDPVTGRGRSDAAFSLVNPVATQAQREGTDENKARRRGVDEVDREAPAVDYKLLIRFVYSIIC